MFDPGLLRAIEALLQPGPDAVDCAPRLFGHWPGGKSFDEWFTADAVSADDDRFQVNFNDGADVLTVERPGRWWRGENSVVVATAQRVQLRTHHTYPRWSRTPGSPRTFTRLMDYRTEPGVVEDRNGHRARWYPPDAPPRPWYVGASRAPALELLLMWPLLQGPHAGER